MSEWINNEVLLENLETKDEKLKEFYQNLEKPCHSCGFCPYGQLVEEFPLHPEADIVAEEHNLYSKLVKGKGWVKCEKTDKGA